MIKVVDLTQHYGVRPVLRNIHLEISSGELVALMGPNGMGKSTLLASIAGALAPQKGYVEIDGMRRRSSEEAELAIRRKVFYLPDHPWLPVQKTGREFLLAVGRLYSVDYDRLFDHIDRLLALFDLDAHGDSPISSYSTGQQKKISICSALVSDAPVLLLDEPFSGGLDPAALLALKKVMIRLAERRDMTVLMTTPVPEIVQEVAHRIAILRDGELIACDTIDGLRTMTSAMGDLQDVLAHFMHADTLANIDRYLEGQQK